MFEKEPQIKISKKKTFNTNALKHNNEVIFLFEILTTKWTSNFNFWGKHLIPFFEPSLTQNLLNYTNPILKKVLNFIINVFDTRVREEQMYYSSGQFKKKTICVILPKTKMEKRINWIRGVTYPFDHLRFMRTKCKM